MECSKCGAIMVEYDWCGERYYYCVSCGHRGVE